MSLNSFRTGLGSITSNPIGKWALFLVSALLVSSLVFSGLGTNLAVSTARRPPRRPATTLSQPSTATPLRAPIFDAAQTALQNQLEQSGRTITLAEQPLLNSAVLDQLIGAKLQLEAAKKMGITVSAAEIAQERAKIVDQLNFRQSLSLPTAASMADIDAALTKSGSQTLEQRLPDDTLRQFILIGDPQSGQPGKLQQAIINSVVVTDADATQFYTKYHTQHILVDNKTRSDAQAKAQAAQIIQKADAPGADFGALAKLYSDDPGTRAKGGDDGFIDQSTPYVPEFKQAAFSLHPGEITPDPVSVAAIRLLRHQIGQRSKPACRRILPKTKPKYLAQIRDQKAQDKYQTLMTGLKAGAKIDVKDPALAGDRAFAQAEQGRQPRPGPAEAGGSRDRLPESPESQSAGAAKSGAERRPRRRLPNPAPDARRRLSPTTPHSRCALTRPWS